MSTTPAAAAGGAAAARPRGRVASLLLDDHRYVFLGTSAIALVGLVLANQPHPVSSFLALSYAVESVLYYVLVAWLVVSAVALVNKLVKWRDYAATSPFASPVARRVERIASYVVCAVVCVFFADRCVVGFLDLVAYAVGSTSNPDDFWASSIYMLYNMRGVYLSGIVTTIVLAVFGTLIAFVLALLMVFLRIQAIDRSDNDFVRFLKVIGSGFASVYSTVVRGTPMMVQSLIIYFGGIGLLQGTGMTVAQTREVWSPFTAALVTISLNSTAYMMEVLRSGIGAVDFGQTEAARSLGLSQWQAMSRVVFPQGVKNSIPALSNELIINLKDSSVLSAISVVDLMFATTTIAGAYYRQMQIYVVAMATYLVLTLVASKLLDMLSRRLDAGSLGPVLGTSDALPAASAAEEH